LKHAKDKLDPTAGTSELSVDRHFRRGLSFKIP